MTREAKPVYTTALSDKAATHAAYEQYLGALAGEHDDRFRQAFREAFLRALHDQLTDRQFEVLWMYEVKGLSGKEIAGKLGISPSAVSRHLTRGKRRLRTLLAYNLELPHSRIS